VGNFFKLWIDFEKEEMLACFVEEQKLCPITGPSLTGPKNNKTYMVITWGVLFAV
jgi:hypothetical protein